ncbi:Dolichyl-diphosphooligosaccharide--protein glycosyltransferase subunit WBP1 [Umbelopsis sp. AD052]|nr:Dolichyl-diphosphooligosaccharide--protein glycosyltransferase subunit WBP1 [Umbelopsis sp. AD052]
MRPIFSILASAAVLLSATLSEAKSLTGNRVLVLLDDLSSAGEYSKFWSSLEDREYKINYSTPQNQSDVLIAMAKRNYDHVVHFAPHSKVAQDSQFSNRALIKFVDMGGNLLIGLTPNTQDAVRDLLREFDIEIDTRNHRVFDESSYDEGLDAGAFDTLVTENIVSPKPIVGEVSAPILFRGVGHQVGSIPLLNRVLASEGNAFSGEVGDSSREKGAIDLVSSLQARNNARVSVAGSLDLFSNIFIDSPVSRKSKSGGVKKFARSGNKEFTDELSRWTFQEKSVLKVFDHRHHKEGETQKLETYRIKDNITYTIEIAEYDGEKWTPYHASDIQLEVIMLDPYIRTTLQEAHIAPEHHYARYKSHLTLPDVYGVFTFKVNYKRPGLTYLTVEDVVAIRPFRHDEYPRFLSAAYPYYVSVGSMIVGFLVFSGTWLFTWGSREEAKVVAQSKK